MEGYQINYYDRDSKIQLSLEDKIVTMKKVDQEKYDNYVPEQEATKLIKVPYVSREKQEGDQEFFTDYYNSLESL